MTSPRSHVRAATLLDMLGVIGAMSQSERGEKELQIFGNTLGGMTAERLACTLFQYGHDTVALVPNENSGRALVVAGFMAQRPGVSRTWMLATDEAWEGYSRELTEYTAAGIKHQLATNLHRVETICPDSHAAAKAWYPRLGLKQEATLAKFYADGSDAALFVALRSVQ